MVQWSPVWNTIRFSTPSGAALENPTSGRSADRISHFRNCGSRVTAWPIRLPACLTPSASVSVPEPTKKQCRASPSTTNVGSIRRCDPFHRSGPRLVEEVRRLLRPRLEVRGLQEAQPARRLGVGLKRQHVPPVPEDDVAGRGVPLGRQLFLALEREEVFRERPADRPPVVAREEEPVPAGHLQHRRVAQPVLAGHDRVPQRGEVQWGKIQWAKVGRGFRGGPRVGSRHRAGDAGEREHETPGGDDSVLRSHKNVRFRRRARRNSWPTRSGGGLSATLLNPPLTRIFPPHLLREEARFGVENPVVARPPVRDHRPPHPRRRQGRQLHPRPRVQGVREGTGGVLRRAARGPVQLVDGGRPPAAHRPGRSSPATKSWSRP